MTTIGDIIAKNLDEGLNENWRDYNPELSDKIAKDIDDYLNPLAASLLNTMANTTEHLLDVIKAYQKETTP